MNILRIVLAALAAGTVIAVIVGMIVGTVRSTREGVDWSASHDRGFLPWNDDDDETR
ncbi:MAG TPA: hypothetical protein VI076_04670 [Actinopolymorphaceae bacterium]